MNKLICYTIGLAAFCFVACTGVYMYKSYEKLRTIQRGQAQMQSLMTAPQSMSIGTCDTQGEKISREDLYKILPKPEDGLTLEIGPFFNPALTGPNVRYFDVLDKEGLKVKAAVEKIDDSRIPEIHYVQAEGDMSVITDKFKAVFSSHNVEHQVDLIKHLQQVATLLEDGGRFVMAIPDHRYCFDHFISPTPLSEVLATHWIGTKVHSLQAILAMRCETTHNDPVEHWKSNSGKTFHEQDPNCYNKALAEFQSANGNYIDSHKWRFTPCTFASIVESLYNMGLSPLKVEKVYQTQHNSNEFYAILYKPAAGGAS